MLDEMTQRNASKFAIFYIYENPKWLFHFSFHVILFLPLMNALVYVNKLNIDQGIREKNKVHEMKNGKSNFGFSYI